jgi:hypothetical protein
MSASLLPHRALLALLAANIGAALAAASAPGSALNDPLPHQLVATAGMQQQTPPRAGGGRVLLRVSVDQRPHVRQASRPFKPGDVLSWRVAFAGLGSPAASITLHAAAPGRTGMLLATLCRACHSGAHGTVTLKAPLAIELDQPTICTISAPCSPQERDQIGIYVNLATPGRPAVELRAQLRFCTTRRTYRNRGSCSPTGYPPLQTH